MPEITNRVVYQKSTETIRVMPENYMVFTKKDGRWYCDPDRGLPFIERCLIFSTFQSQYSSYLSGEQLVNLIAPCIY